MAGGAVSSVAFNEMRGARDALISVNQLQAENLASFAKWADVSDLKAERES